MSKEKDKAKDLINKFQVHSYCTARNDTNESAKECAIIHCDGILSELLLISDVVDLSDTIDHWNKIKSEIIKL